MHKVKDISLQDFALYTFPNSYHQRRWHIKAWLINFKHLPSSLVHGLSNTNSYHLHWLTSVVHRPWQLVSLTVTPPSSQRENMWAYTLPVYCLSKESSWKEKLVLIQLSQERNQWQSLPFIKHLLCTTRSSESCTQVAFLTLEELHKWGSIFVSF